MKREKQTSQYDCEWSMRVSVCEEKRIHPISSINDDHHPQTRPVPRLPRQTTTSIEQFLSSQSRKMVNITGSIILERISRSKAQECWPEFLHHSEKDVLSRLGSCVGGCLCGDDRV